jgi:RNA binding exosome subunit
MTTPIYETEELDEVKHILEQILSKEDSELTLTELKMAIVKSLRLFNKMDKGMTELRLLLEQLRGQLVLCKKSL